MIPYEQMLMADAFTNYRQIMGDVTLSPTMGQYLDMANNAMGNSGDGHDRESKLRPRSDAALHHRHHHAQSGRLCTA